MPKVNNKWVALCTVAVYPEQAITDFPQQVLQRQSANVDLVSGATGSWKTFNRRYKLPYNRLKAKLGLERRKKRTGVPKAKGLTGKRSACDAST